MWDDPPRKAATGTEKNYPRKCVMQKIEVAIYESLQRKMIKKSG